MWCLYTSSEDLKAAHQTAWPGHHQELENPQRYSTGVKLFWEQLVQKQLLHIAPLYPYWSGQARPRSSFTTFVPKCGQPLIFHQAYQHRHGCGHAASGLCQLQRRKEFAYSAAPRRALIWKKKDLEKQRTASVGGTNNLDLLFQTPQLTEPLFVSTQFTWNSLHYSSGQEVACWQIKYQMRDRWHHFWRSTKPSFLYAMLMALKSPLLIFTIFPDD